MPLLPGRIISGVFHPRRASQSMSALLVCNGPFRIQPSQLVGQSKPCLFMLTCLPVSLLHLLFFCPSTPTLFLYLSPVCPIDLFVSAPLMVPSFGTFVSTPGIIAILCETKRRAGIKMSSSPLNCFDVIAERDWGCVCVCVSNRLVSLRASSYLLKVGISKKLI